MKPVSKSVCVKGQEYDRDKKTDPKKSIYNCSFFISSSPVVISCSFFLTYYYLLLFLHFFFISFFPTSYLILFLSHLLLFISFPPLTLSHLLSLTLFFTSYLLYFLSLCDLFISVPCFPLIYNFLSRLLSLPLSLLINSFIPFRISLFSEIHFSFLFLIFFIHISLIHLFSPQFSPQFIHSFRLFQSHAVSCQVENEAVTV